MLRATSPLLSPTLGGVSNSSVLRRSRKRLQLRLYSLANHGAERALWRTLTLSCLIFAVLFILSISAGIPSISDRAFLGLDRHSTAFGSPHFPKSIVTSRGPEGKDVYHHIAPYTGNAYHITTSIGPAKDYYRTHYILTSLWFFEDDDPFKVRYVQQQITPYAALISVECDYDDGREIVPALSEIQGRGEYYHVECDVPSWLAKDLNTASSPQRRQRGLEKMREMNIMMNVWIDWDEEDESQLDRSVQMRPHESGVGYQILLASHRIEAWDQPEMEAEVAICVSPLSFDKTMSPKDLVEWRLFHAYQGVDRVHWYTRNADFLAWTATANNLLGVNDTVFRAPNMSPSTPTPMHHADQAIWYQDCILRYGFFDEWLALIDVDEYLFPIEHPYKFGVRDRLRDMPANIGSVLTYQTYYGGEPIADAPRVDGYDQFPRNAFKTWEPNYLLAGARYTKGIHRASGTRQIWVHNVMAQGWDYDVRKEDAQVGAKGSLNLLHSRRKKYEDLNYTQQNDVDTPEWRSHWRELAESMRGLEILHTLPSSV